MSYEIALRDIGQSLLDRMRKRVWLYGCSIFAVFGKQPRYAGTGTFVSVYDSYYMLTARHVWHWVGARPLALALHPDRPLIVMPADILNPITCDLDAAAQEEWGPDLALIRIPDVFVPEIRQHKVFYNIDRHRPRIEQHPPAYKNGAWAILGAVGEQSTFGSTEAHLQISLLASVVLQVHQRNNFDYIDLSYFHEGRTDLPKSYGGLSGSGLWYLPIFKSPSGAIDWTEEVVLEGVAFYQRPSGPDEGVIRCHDRESLYGRLLSLVR